MFSQITSIASATASATGSTLSDFLKKVVKDLNVSEELAQQYIDSLLNVFESLPLAIQDLARARSTVDVISALLRAFKMLTRKNVLSGAFDMSSWIVDKLKEFSQDEDATIAGTKIQSDFEFGWCVRAARKVLDGYKDVRNSPLVLKIKNLFCYFLSFGFLEALGIKSKLFGYDEMSCKKIRKEYNSKCDFVFEVLEDVVWVLERCSQAIALKSFQPFLHTGAAYAAWSKKAQKLLLDQHKMSNPAAFPAVCDINGVETEPAFQESAFHKDLDTVIDQGDNMMKYMDKGFEREAVRKILTEVKLMSIKFRSKDYAQRDRKPPFAVLITGDSKIAKTQFMNILFQHYGKVHSKDCSPECMWTRTPQDKFYSGYRPSKWCIRLDDVAQFNPALGTLDPTLADIIMLINGVSLVAPMPDLEDKGVIPVKPELLLASTNRADLNAQAYFTCPLAMRRRFPYVIEISVKKQFCVIQTENGVAITTTFVDESKIPPLGEGEYMNIWDIRVLKLVAQPGINGSTPRLEIVCEFTDANGKDIYDFLEFYSHLSIEFDMHQNLAMVATAKMAQVEVCKKCYRPTNRCHCPAVQAQPQEVSPYMIDFINEHGRQPNDDNEFTMYLRMKLAAALVRDGFDSELRLPLTMERQDELESDIGDEGSEISDDEMEEILHRETDRSSIMNRCEDWIETSEEIIHVWAKIIAASTKNTITTIKDCSKALYAKGVQFTGQALARFSDLMMFYQLQKLHDKIVSVGDVMASKWKDWRLSFVCTALLGGWLAYKGITALSSYLKVTDSEDRIHSESSMENVTCDLCLKKVQGNITSKDLPRDEKPNPWVRDEILLSDYYVPTKSLGWKNLSRDEVMRRIRQNVIHLESQFEVDGNISHMPGTALCVHGFVYMINNHCLPEEGMLTVYMSQCPTGVCVSPNIKFTLDQTSIMRIPEKDIAFFTCRCTPPRADLTKLFFKQKFGELMCRGNYVHCRSNSSPEVADLLVQRSELSTLMENYTQVVWTAKLDPLKETIVGDCGSPMVAHTQMGPIIVGIHQFLQDNHTVGAVEVLSSDIEMAIQRFGPQVQCGTPSFVKEPLGPLHQKSVLRWEEEGQARIYGSAPSSSFRAAPKSRVADTFISKAAQEEGFVKRCDAPVMKGPEVWHNNIEPTITQEFIADKKVIDICVQSFASDVLKRLTKKDLEQIIILDDDATLNGVDGVRFLDKINRNTSMGYPYRKSKRNFLKPKLTQEEYSDRMEYVEEIMEEVELIRDVYSRGERYMPVFVMSLKDEPIPLKKIAIKKTRGFMGGPAAWQFFYRKYLLAFVRVFQLNPTIFEGAPGMNPFSCSWKKLYEYLTYFGVDRIIAGDYAKYDKRMSPEFILAAFDFIILILEAAGWTEEQILPVRCMATDVAFPVTDIQGDFVELFGSNPSGHALTVIINCIVNCIYMRYVYYMLNPEHNLTGFKDSVHLMTYGDDNAMGVCDSAPWFNHTAIMEELAKIGVVYTMADKEAESVPYVNIYDITFLKRCFIPSIDGRVNCPLEWASIDKMLTSCTVSKSVTPEKQAIDAIRSAMGEFYQYGETVYNEQMEKMKRIVHKSGLDMFVEPNTFPAYKQLYDAYPSYCVYKDCCQYHCDLHCSQE